MIKDYNYSTPQYFDYELELNNYREFDNLDDKALYGNFLANYSNKEYLIIKFRGNNDIFEKNLDNSEYIEPYSIDVYFWLIDFLENRDFAGKTVVLTNLQFNTKENLLASIKLTLLTKGDFFHAIHEYNNRPLSKINQVNKTNFYQFFDPVNTQYEQLGQLLNVLNEYNGTVGIIEKYLKLYQVLEELMIRYSLAEFFNNIQTAVTARILNDFQKKMNNTEQLSLDELLKMMLKNDNTNTTSAGDIRLLIGEIKYLWDGCTNNFQSATNDDLKKYPPLKNYSNLNSLSLGGLITDILNNNTNKTNELAQCLSYLIYKMRNMIVHNKATERHITYVDLEAYFDDHLSIFYLPMLELLVFYLLLKLPEKLKYSQQQLNIQFY